MREHPQTRWPAVAPMTPLLLTLGWATMGAGCSYPMLPSVDVAQPTFVAVEVPRNQDTPTPYTLLVGVTEVTVGQWRELMGTDPTGSECEHCAVTMVSWYDAAAFANALSEREGLSPCYELNECSQAEPYRRRHSPGTFTSHQAGLACASFVSVGPSCTGYRLPTREEWRAYGDVADLGTRPRQMSRYARAGGSPSARSGVVARRLPNQHGLYDTLGNVEEWLDTRVPRPQEVGRRRRAVTHPAWFVVAATCFRSRWGEVAATHLHHEVGSWAQNCQGFRLVRTASPSSA